jgi:hypothetical protein
MIRGRWTDRCSRIKGWHPMGRADEFRKNAQAAHQFAKAAAKPEDQKTWLELARHWDRLAQEAERNPGAFPPGNGT